MHRAEPDHGAVVAFEVLAAELAGSDVARARFAREQRVTARVEHENAVRVLDVGSLTAVATS